MGFRTADGTFRTERIVRGPDWLDLSSAWLDGPHAMDAKASTQAMVVERAYPAEAGVRGWHREIVLNRKAGKVNVTDSFQLTKTQSVELNLITIQTPSLNGPGRITLSGGFQLSFDPALQVTLDEHSSDDARLKPNWGPTVRRIRLSTQTPPAQGAYTLTLEKL